MANPYRSALQRLETAREAEARVLRETSRLLESAQARHSASDLASAVTTTRKLWSTFVRDLAEEGNQLPGAIKANLLSIAGAVDRSCSAALAGDAVAVATLVEINRNIAAALG